ncbi:hypothetical protein HPB49_012308 [Dermacentor silvarum]|uniref:Uncharacterized protein n=1 Tax=Dermacentor silvarum TaxID=543639 RepID=A0ACB8CR03_DERSI|nr:hypothetical protein HPB49_012308 [Dermacentor silvarum]
MYIRKAYDHVSHEAFVRILHWPQFPSCVCSFVEVFLQARTFSIRLADHAAGLDTYIPVANKYGRRVLALRPIQLNLDQQPLHEASTIRVLGLLDASGSAGTWVKKAKQQAAETIQWIRRIAKKSGKARTDMARLLVHSVLQPRLVYSVKFQNFTKTEWTRLEANNHEAMWAITGLPRLTPLPALQTGSHLNNLDELVPTSMRVRP